LQPAGEGFEMAENGNFIVFAPAGVQPEVEDLVIALDKTTGKDTGIQ
jgi:hypothetical protein